MKITFGKYINRDSLVHRLDGRLKFTTFLLFLVLLFLKSDFLPYLFFLAFFLFIFFLAKLPKIIFWYILQPVTFMFVFLFLFNTLELKSAADVDADDVIWGWKFLQLKISGLVLTFYYSLRVFLVILLTVLLITTIRPKMLTLSIEGILKPLEKVRFPVHIFSMIISLTLRLVPTFIEEAQNIMEAQASRGLDFKHSGFFKKIKVLISLLIPLIVSIFKRADEMAIAMESRGYNPFQPRSRYQQFIVLRSNWVWFGFVLMIFFTVIFYLYLTPEHDLLHNFPLNKYLYHQH